MIAIKGIFILIIGFFVIPVYGQKDFFDNPLDAIFITEDVTRFWLAFDQLEELGNRTFDDYISNGSPGVKGFLKYRIISSEDLYKMVISKRQDYLKSRDVLDDLENQKKKIRAVYAALKYWYPKSKLPPIYFVIGRFNSGGTVSPKGIILGTEMMNDLEGLPGLVAHEIIHFQQKLKGKNILLKQSIKEGSADFIGELISGEHINQKAFSYGNLHEEALKEEFSKVIYEKDYTDWLYSTSGKDGRPNDLGYWMGYKITEAYFNKTEDKHKAIEDILKIKNANEFLKESGYLSEYLK